MLHDESADFIVRIPRIRRSLERLVDLVADLLTHGIRSCEPLIIAARVQRYGNIKKRLAILQADIGTCRVYQRCGIGPAAG